MFGTHPLRRTRVALLTLTLVLGALLVAPSSANAVIGGKKSTYGPWAVRMLVDGKPACTGTALSDRWIISASHCFFDQPDQPFKDAQITFRYGTLDVREATEVKVIKGSRVPNPHGADMMMIKVERMTGVTPAKLSIKRARAGLAVRVLGWGATCDGDDPNTCQSKVLKQSDAKILNVKKNRERCAAFGTVGGYSLCGMTTKGVPAGGDSGAPMMTLAPKGKERLVGVFFGSDRERMIGADAVLPQQKWIRATLKK